MLADIWAQARSIVNVVVTEHKRSAFASVDE